MSKEVKPDEKFEVHDLSDLPMMVAKLMMHKIQAANHNKPVFFKLPLAKIKIQNRAQWEKSSTKCPYCGSMLTKDNNGDVICSNNKLNDIYIYIRDTLNIYGKELTERILSRKEHSFLDDYLKGKRLECHYVRGVDDDYYDIVGH